MKPTTTKTSHFVRWLPGAVRRGKLALTFLILLSGLSWEYVFSATFDSSSANIRHPYFPFPLGARQQYRGTGSATGLSIVHAAAAVEVVDHVQCMKVVEKKSTEPDSYFWIAQSTDGVIWQLRKYDGLMREYSETDSLFLMSNPVIGSRCGLGFDDSDELVVVATNAIAETPLGRFAGCVVIEHDWGGKSRYYLAPRAGIVRVEELNDYGYEIAALELVSSTLAKPDSQRPSVTITSGLPAGGRLTNAIVNFRGSAADNLGVAAVQYCLSNASGTTLWQPAQGTRQWSFTVSNLVYGLNLIKVRAQDLAGNWSAPLSRACVRLSPLLMTTNGCGRISSPGLSQPSYAEVNRTYTITALPGAGWLFSNWVARAGGVSQVVGTSPKLLFVAQPEMTLQANFVPNPFIARKGSYAGLSYDKDNYAHPSAGFFSGTLTDRGGFSARLQMAGKTYALAGQFALDGTLSKTIPRLGSSPLNLNLQLDPLSQDAILGRISDGTWTAELIAYRATFNTATNPAPQAGKYTLIIPGSEDASIEPGGDGFGTLTVDKSGNVIFAGTLGDGTKVSQSTFIARAGFWPLYLPLYGGAGSLLGWLAFTNEPGSDIRGLLNWIKPAQPANRMYPAGFTIRSEAVGSSYRPPALGGQILNFTNAVLVLENGNLAQTVTNQVSLGPGNQVKNLGNSKLTFSFTTPSGAFTGGLASPPTARPIPFSGAVLQKGNMAAGLFLGTNQTGRIWIGPRQ
jgi:hypothetical protein